MQRAAGRATSFFWIPACAFAMRYLLGYRIQNAAELRRRYRQAMRDSERPVLICANHLTLVDSAILAWALGGSWWYLLSYRRLPWNLPDYNNFARRWHGRAAIWFTKCIPIVRGGAREQVSGVIKRVQHLLARGETALIFAEGGRSRTGRVETDRAAHGMGRIMASVRGCKAMCVYLRGELQDTWSALPRWGDSFYVDFEVVEPDSELKGMRRSRDLAQQITDQLARMEEKYFARR